jgi:hypothetical protein
VWGGVLVCVALLGGGVALRVAVRVAVDVLGGVAVAATGVALRVAVLVAGAKAVAVGVGCMGDPE